jgi:hypothetical protein
MRTVLGTTSLLTILACVAWGQSPPAETAVAIGGKNLTVKYSSPSVRGRKIFGSGGLLSMDPTYPIWRAGANSATLFHTDADLNIGGLSVPKGNYSLYVLVQNPDAWELIVNKEVGQWGLTYNQKLDVGRVKMTMSKPPAPIERFKITVSAASANSGKLQMEWENHVASVPITLK